MEYFDHATKTSLLEAFVVVNPSVEFVRYVFVDFSGIVRMRILTTEYCLKVHNSTRRYGCGPGLMLMNVTGSSERNMPSLRQQKFDLVPDWTSIRICEFSPGHAWVMCFVRAAEEANPFFQCPRFLLATVLKRAERDLKRDTTFLIGFEIEFTLLDASLQPVNTTDVPEGWTSTSGLRDKKLKFMEHVVRALRRSHIGVSHFHVECFHQLEFATDPFPPMQAVDNLVYTVELLKNISIQYEYRATVSIKPVAATASGTQPAAVCHLHFSISDHEVADNFLAGILARLADIAPFAMPTYDSYLNPDFDPDGTLICWGTENRDVAIRAIETNHWELRVSDATANFHLLVAVMLNAGIDGIETQQPLTWKDLRNDSQSYTREVLANMGVTNRLPLRLRDSLQVLRESEYLTSLLGVEMKRLYHMVKEKDEEAFRCMSDEERRLQYIRYF